MKNSTELIQAAREAWETQKSSWERKGIQYQPVSAWKGFYSGFLAGYGTGHNDADEECPWR